MKIDEAKANEVEKRLNVKLIHKALFHTSIVCGKNSPKGNKSLAVSN